MNAILRAVRRSSGAVTSVSTSLVHPGSPPAAVRFASRPLFYSSTLTTTEEPQTSISSNRSRFVYSTEQVLRSKLYYQKFHNTSPAQYNQDLNRIVSRPMIVDTLKLVRKFEQAGLPTKQAEAMTILIADLMADNAEGMSRQFASKGELEQLLARNEAAVQVFRHDFTQNYENEMAKLQRDIERQQVELEKLKTELKYEVDKVISGHRLDLNLERGRIRDELQMHDTRAIDTAQRLDKEINDLKTSIEAGKSDIIKYCVGTIVGAVSVGLGVVRMLL